jgi:hypothetical protein
MRISIRTAGDWQAHELTELLGAVESIYNVFLAAAHAARALDAESRRLVEEWGIEPAVEYRLPEPIPEDEADEGTVIPPWVASTRSTDLARYVESLHKNIRVVAPNDLLRIASIRMASPGNISFEGLGEPMRELRELLKDLSYRNAAEKQLSRLEVAEKHLDLALRYGMVGPAQVPQLLEAVLNGADVVEELLRLGRVRELTPGSETDTAG